MVASAQIAAAARTAIADHGRFVLALSGGTTPGATYERLATHYAGVINWDQVHVLFVDERGVPPSDPASNFRLVNETLLSRVPVPVDQVYRIHGEMEPRSAAAEYARTVASLLDGDDIDLAIMGMGADGHTASLFPGDAALTASDLVVAVEAPAGTTPASRVTLSLPALARVREALVLVSGASKAAAVSAVRSGSSDLPAARVGAARVTFLVDEAASGG